MIEKDEELIKKCYDKMDEVLININKKVVKHFGIRLSKEKFKHIRLV